MQTSDQRTRPNSCHPRDQIETREFYRVMNDHFKQTDSKTMGQHRPDITSHSILICTLSHLPFTFLYLTEFRLFLFIAERPGLNPLQVKFTLWCSLKSFIIILFLYFVNIDNASDKKLMQHMYLSPEYVKSSMYWLRHTRSLKTNPLYIYSTCSPDVCTLYTILGRDSTIPI